MALNCVPRTEPQPLRNERRTVSRLLTRGGCCVHIEETIGQCSAASFCAEGRALNTQRAVNQNINLQYCTGEPCTSCGHFLHSVVKEICCRGIVLFMTFWFMDAANEALYLVCRREEFVTSSPLLLASIWWFWRLAALQELDTSGGLPTE